VNQHEPKACLPQARIGSVVEIDCSSAPNVPDVVPKPLTSRECEVALWLGEGKRDAEIGAILGISTRTAQKHVERIREKLGVETRTAAARAFLFPNAAQQHVIAAMRDRLPRP
jgi:DNA-binding CsgD family transcriptional regulator